GGIRDRLDLRDAAFHVGNQPPHARRLYAPTEFCPWRKKTIQGEVHDENTWVLGGVAPHAGLFGTLDDLSRWGLCLRSSLRGGSGGLARPETVARFARRALPRARGDWALGFMLPGLKGASCGKYFSRLSVGHLGFTGTSLWYDPRRDLLVTVLSNRVHPTRENKLFPQLRGFLHDSVVESLQA
ncbi:MAG: serine hydrolase, partial [Bdellovibrionaceae bacterium]|nr:serine hydrolase [Pseudobdellovibrionaceae bacterium]